MFTLKKLTSLPPPDARTPIKLCASARLHWFALGVQLGGLVALLVLIYLSQVSMQFKVISASVVCGVMLVDALYKGFFRPINSKEIIAFGLHIAARLDVFKPLDNTAEALDSAPGTVATMPKSEPLEIFVQTRSGVIEHGQLTATQFVAPFFTCVRFRLFAEAPQKWWQIRRFKFNRQMVLLPDNIDEDEFRQCRVLLRWT